MRTAFLGKVHQISREGGDRNGRTCAGATRNHKKNARIRVRINPYCLVGVSTTENLDWPEVMGNSYASETPITDGERLYASTLAINGGKYDEAISHLRLVRDEDPETGEETERVVLEDAPGLGERHTPPEAIEQPRFELPLQLGHVLRERRLAQVQDLGRAAEAVGVALAADAADPAVVGVLPQHPVVVPRSQCAGVADLPVGDP